jgi:hypothetical protein
VVRFSAEAGNFFLHHRVQTGSGAHPASYPMVTRALGVKRPGREADHSPSSNAEIRNAWNCTSAHTIHLHGVVHRAQGQLYLYFPIQIYLLFITNRVTISVEFHGVMNKKVGCIRQEHTKKVSYHTLIFLQSDQQNEHVLITRVHFVLFRSAV